MSHFSATIKALHVPAYIRRWLQRQFDRKILVSEELTIWASKPSSKKEREQWHKEWKTKTKNRDRRLARIARKMEKAGMSRADADIVRRGGWGN